MPRQLQVDACGVRGGYDPAADAIFNKTGVDIYFMEYDTERAGGYEPLRLLPKGSSASLPGFITTKTGDLESLDTLKRQFDEASKYAPLDQLGIAPSAASPPPKRATPSPWTTSAASWSWW